MRSLIAVSLGMVHQSLRNATRPRDQRISRNTAVARAIAAIDNTCDGVRTWRAVDAALLDPCWICLLEDTEALHMVEVDARTGAVDHLSSTPKDH
jgi:hypothetical protein